MNGGLRPQLNLLPCSLLPWRICDLGRGRRRFHQLGAGCGEGAKCAAGGGFDGESGSVRAADGERGSDLVFAEAMRSVAVSRAGRGVMVVLSDFLTRRGPRLGWRDLEARPRWRAFDTYCLQVLSPASDPVGKDAGRGLVGDPCA